MAMSFLLIASFPDSLIAFRGHLIDALIKKGLKIHVAVPDLSSDSIVYELLREKGVEIHDVPLSRTGMNPFKDFLLFIYLCRLILTIRPDFIFCYTIKPVIYGSLAAWLMRVPRRYVLITGLGYAFSSKTLGIQKFVHIAIRQLYRLSLSGVNNVFFQNKDDEKLFKDLKIMSSMKRSVVINGSGVDVSLFTPAALPKNAQFLMIARLLGDKGVREYAAAASIIKQRHPEVVFKLAGWIDSNPDVIAQAELDAWIKGGEIDYLGRLDDVQPAIAACSVYVLPSYREGIPRTVLEAMAMGRAIITTYAPGCRETVVDGENGFLVSVKSVESLVYAMHKFIDDESLAAKMGAVSRQIAVDKYDVHKVNAAILKEMNI